MQCFLSCSCLCKVCSLNTTSNTRMARSANFTLLSLRSKDMLARLTHSFNLIGTTASNCGQWAYFTQSHYGKCKQQLTMTTSHRTTICVATPTAWSIIMRMRKVKIVDYARSRRMPEALNLCNEAFIDKIAKISGLRCPLSTPYHL